ncbi:hypothetical protein [Micromonospora aurantiaca (nom. illeg.)]|uniref:hypothetical protein n=1 Tax=Micromonospora aurantiaca (nom. illeg.) TaxID=47850 RepID=UPI00367806C1
MLTFLFPFKDPASFPALPKQLLAPHRDILDRYCDEAEHLAESQYLNADSEVRITVKNQGAVENIESAFPPKEISRGFQVTFRQFYSKNERAAFVNVRNVIAAAAKKEWNNASEEWEQLALWGKAQNKLLGNSLKDLTQRKLYPHSELITNENFPPPQPLISAFFYGDGIHYDRTHARALSALRQTPFDNAWSELRLGEAVFGLAHLYIGFSGVVRAVQGITNTPPTPFTASETSPRQHPQ